MGAGFQPTSGPALERPSDLAAILTNLGDGDVLFVDEIHRMPRTVEEVLYPALEDFSLDVVLGKGPTARSIRLDLPRFTLIGATTQARPDHVAASRALRVQPAAGLLRRRGPDDDRAAQRRHPRGRDGAGGRRTRSRRALARHPADREPAAAPRARRRGGPPRRRDHRRRGARRARDVRGRRGGARPARPRDPARDHRPVLGRAGGARRPSRPPSGRSRTPSRTWWSPTSSSWGSCSARRAAASPPRAPTHTSASPRRASSRSLEPRPAFPQVELGSRARPRAMACEPEGPP